MRPQDDKEFNWTRNFSQANIYKMRIYLIFFLLLASCQPNSREDFHSEGTSVAKSLIFDLREVKSKEELLQIAPKIKKKVQKLTNLMILAAASTS